MKKEDIGSPDRGPEIKITRLDASCLLDPRSEHLLSSQIHIWEVPLDISESSFRSLVTLLSEEEQKRAARFHFERDAKRFSVARGSVRTILAGYIHTPAAELRFVAAQHGKPRLENPPADIHFSVSHSGDWALLAVALSCEVGVDIEVMRDNVEVDNLAERFFSPHERESLRRLPLDKKLPAFFRCWTAKEAFLKAQGIGLSRSLESFDIDLDATRARLLATRPDPTEAQRWSVLGFETVPGYAAAAAVEGAIASVQVFRCS